MALEDLAFETTAQRKAWYMLLIKYFSIVYGFVISAMIMNPST